MGQAQAEGIDMPSPIVPAGIKRNNRFRRGGLLRKTLTVFPLMTVPVLVYILMAIMAGKASDPALPSIQGLLDHTLFSLPMLSGVKWQLRSADLLLLLALLMLSLEIVKSTSTKSGAIMNHAASMGLMIFCLIGFLIFNNFATSIFFILTMMCLLDVLAGVMVTIVSARRDFGVGDGLG